MAGHVAQLQPGATHVECWPATLLDWLAMHASVRLGRLDRHSGIRAFRGRLTNLLSRGGSCAQFQTAYGFPILLPCVDVPLLLMASRGVLFHQTLVEVLRQTVQPGDVFVDGGSNIGFYSLLVGNALKGKGKVICFEPDPRTFPLLLRNISLNRLQGITHAEQKALFDKNGTCEFSIATDEPMLSSIIPRDGVQSERISVTTVRLDDFLTTVGEERVDIIKLDLEGAEPSAVRGMSKALQSAKLIVCEVNEPQLSSLGVDPVNFIRSVVTMGSFDEVFFIDENLNRLNRWSPECFLSVLHSYQFVNVLCAKSGVVNVPSVMDAKKL